MKRKRYRASSVVLDNNKLWVMGGYDGIFLITSEYIQIGEDSISGPDLPNAVYCHTSVAWNSSSFMLIGGVRYIGSNGHFFANTFYFTEDKPEWIPGPDLKEARKDHAVGLGMDRATNDPYIAVTGGHDGSNTLASVELLYEGETEWQAGKH